MCKHPHDVSLWVLSRAKEWQRVNGTSFLVDCFGKSTQLFKCKSWFLTHFHSDHYKGLRASFKQGKCHPSLCPYSQAECMILQWHVMLCVWVSRSLFRAWTSGCGCSVELLHAGHIYCTHITAKLAHDRLKVGAQCLLQAHADVKQ